MEVGKTEGKETAGNSADKRVRYFADQLRYPTPRKMAAEVAMNPPNSRSYLSQALCKLSQGPKWAQ
jgi:hypothetical protein